MFLRRADRLSHTSNGGAFNLTPIIDIVFLLMIFFMVVAQFIEAENFDVEVPDNCEFAERDERQKGQITTVTVIKTDGPDSEFAVGSEIVAVSDYPGLVEKLAELIDLRLKDLPEDSRVVTLRIDKDIPYGQAQYALAAIAASIATDIKLAALKDKHQYLQ